MVKVRPAFLLAVLAAVAGGCASAEAPDPPTSDTSRSDPEAVAEAIAAIPADQIRSVVAGAHHEAEQAAECLRIQDWITHATAAAEELDRAAAAIDDDPDQLGQWGFSEQSQLVADEIQSLLADEPTCPGDDPDAVLALTGQVSGAIDRFRTATTAGLLGLASGFWLNFDYLGHTIEADRMLATDDGIDVLIVGDSAAKRGFDPVAISEQSGQPTMNAAIDGLLPSMVGPWLTELEALGARPGTVVMGVTNWGAVVPCTDARPLLLGGFADNRSRAFAGLGELGVTDAFRVIGEPVVGYSSPLLERYRTSHPQGAQGLFHDQDQVPALVVRNQVEYHTRLFADPEVCEEAAMQFETVAADLVDQGTRVIVVAMPVSDAMASLHPDGRAGHQTIVDRYRTGADRSGAEFLALTDALVEQEFGDPAHPNQAGQGTLTDLLAAEIDR